MGYNFQYRHISSAPHTRISVETWRLHKMTFLERQPGQECVVAWLSLSPDRFWACSWVTGTWSVRELAYAWLWRRFEDIGNRRHHSTRESALARATCCTNTTWRTFPRGTTPKVPTNTSLTVNDKWWNR
jgi:hypothetical protein